MATNDADDHDDGNGMMMVWSHASPIYLFFRCLWCGDGWWQGWDDDGVFHGTTHKSRDGMMDR